jgi:hypothetical protein
VVAPKFRLPEPPEYDLWRRMLGGATGPHGKESLRPAELSKLLAPLRPKLRLYLGMPQEFQIGPRVASKEVSLQTFATGHVSDEVLWPADFATS